MIDALGSNNGRGLSGRFKLLEKLGAGGQGEVWRAHDETRGVDVALKVLNPSLARDEAAWAAFEREYEIASRLDHPAILKVYPPYREGDFVALPMELASGGDLRRLRGASYLEIVPVLIEIAQALEHAHDRGIVHRDLKPGNILFDARGRVRVADFGIASSLQGEERPVPRAAVASPFTASPEQLRGEPPSIADDIYGLGALAYELLSGYPPYYPRFDVKRVLEEPVPELKPSQQIPQQLSSLVMRMLAKRADQRPATMRAVIDDLDAALNDTLTFEFDRIEGEPKSALAAQPAAANVTAPVSLAATTREAIIVAPPPQSPPPPSRAVSHLADEATAPRARDLPSADKTIPRHQAQPAEREPQPEPIVSEIPAATAPRWEDLKFEHAPSLMRLEPIRPKRWPWVALAVLAAAAFGVFYWLPRYAPAAMELPALPSAAGSSGSSSDAGESIGQRLATAREEFDKRLAALETRGAGVWGGKEFAEAKTRAAESVGAFDAGNPQLAEERLKEASRLLGVVEGKADEALATQIANGEKALAAGQEEVARQAFEFALRIDPENQKASQLLRRVGSLGGVLPLLAEGENAEAARDYARAVQNYSQALSLDPNNEKARAGLARANAALGDDNYAKAVGTGFAALGAGRLEQAREAFEKARSIRPNGAEADTGLKRVNAAMSARGFASARQRAAALEAEERWAEAVQEYDAVLKVDPSLAFARQGRARAAARAELSRRLQSLIDEPHRLAEPAVRKEAEALMAQARQQEPFGPVIRSQVTRLEILLPEFDKPVRLALISDNATQVAIQRVGQFGSFSRREVELKPGKYTVVGTRQGYRDVRRDITVAPGDQIQTISVSCVEPI
jgi:serine/threonine protein kinase/tetratricopeptide (TPR) repeat protein